MTVTVENLTYTQIKEMMIQRWESIETLGLNEKGNKGKGKVVEEKEESGMKTALNAFKKGGRGRESRDRGERGRRGRGAGADSTQSTQTPNTTQSKPQPSSTTTQHNSTNPPPPQQTKPNKIKCWNCKEEGHGV
jgi:hypothetical protein